MTITGTLPVATTAYTALDPVNGGAQLPYPTDDALVANLAKYLRALAEETALHGPGRLVGPPVSLGTAAPAAGGAAVAMSAPLALPGDPAGTLVKVDLSLGMAPATALASIVTFSFSPSSAVVLGSTGRRAFTPASALTQNVDYTVFLRLTGGTSTLSITGTVTAGGAATVALSGFGAVSYA